MLRSGCIQNYVTDLSNPALNIENKAGPYVMKFWKYTVVTVLGSTHQSRHDFVLSHGAHRYASIDCGSSAYCLPTGGVYSYLQGNDDRHRLIPYDSPGPAWLNPSRWNAGSHDWQPKRGPFATDRSVSFALLTIFLPGDKQTPVGRGRLRPADQHTLFGAVQLKRSSAQIANETRPNPNMIQPRVDNSS